MVEDVFFFVLTLLTLINLPFNTLLFSNKKKKRCLPRTTHRTHTQRTVDMLHFSPHSPFMLEFMYVYVTVTLEVLGQPDGVTSLLMPCGAQSNTDPQVWR